MFVEEGDTRRLYTIYTMSYEIQNNIFVENCIKCGQRPVIDQSKAGWEVKCDNRACKNVISGPFIDYDTWNRVNKTNVNLNPNAKLKRSA